MARRERPWAYSRGVELQQPAGLEFGPDGNLYVASHGPNPILRYDGKTGVFMDIFVAAGASRCFTVPLPVPASWCPSR
jgi:hypothetical protein